MFLAVLVLARVKLVRNWRVEKFHHYLSVERLPKVWTPLKSVRDMLEIEHEALAREGFRFRDPLNKPLLQLDSVVGRRSPSPQHS